MSAPTPGPWRQLPLGDFGSVNVVAQDGKPVAFTGNKSRSESENQANARLIASAPELLAACKEMMIEARERSVFRRTQCDFKLAIAAIAKAEGNL